MSIPDHVWLWYYLFMLVFIGILGVFEQLHARGIVYAFILVTVICYVGVSIT